MEHLFCPYCNNEDTISFDDVQLCSHCGQVYSVAEQQKKLSEERLGLRLPSSLELPKTKKIKLKTTNSDWEIKITTGKDGGVYYDSDDSDDSFKRMISLLDFTGFVAVIIALTKGKIEVAAVFIFIVGLIFIFWIELRKYLDIGADVIKFSFKNSELTWVKYGTPSIIYGIEADRIYYELEGDNSKVRMKALDTKKFDEVLANHLSPAEARWLALFLRESLKTEDIGGR